MAEDKALTENVQVKFSKKDLTLLEAAAAKARLKLSPYIRHVVMEQIEAKKQEMFDNKVLLQAERH
jgi:hypothetical protein